ncbi:tRNA lysidine(34) synthetase TilS [Cupriavidus sp. AU9028]|uniref:tRNA lysidine(34) synthetase TilS n=1 Tax=Cupriavidus sp. AU9028 TaxID=2871157 RepID=UPI0021030653|nr:tRNA lysidine(34) synthetase TilS [Cupriavidus sp. AU9028]
MPVASGAPGGADWTDALKERVAQAMQACAALVVSGQGSTGGEAGSAGASIAVALSGGRDSVALLHATREVLAESGEGGAAPLALHVHHGLQAQADQWDAFCAGLCERWQVPYRCARVAVVPVAGEGLEAAARRARYDALQRMCREEGVRYLLFAHHRDDQVETVLLRLFRGSGVHGLAGMPAMRPLSADSDTWLLRPWLELPRSAIEAYAERQGLRWVDDPSNDDPRFARNALRQHLPALAASFPSLYANVAQAAEHLGSAAHALDALAQRQLAAIRFAGRDEDTYSELDIAGLMALPEAHADAVLRLWLRQCGTRAPSTARLAAMRAQLLRAAADGGGQGAALRHDGLVLRRFQGRLLACRTPVAPPAVAVTLSWHGEATLAVPQWGGELHFLRTDAGSGGVPEAVLRRSLEVGPRQPGDRIVLRPGGPARALKQAYQEAGVPAWRRPFLPVVRAGGQLVLAAGLGMHHRWPVDANLPCWRVEWRPAAGLAPAPTNEAG